MLSVAVFETGEKPARRVVDLIAECFAEEQIAVSMTETKPGAWGVTVYFESPPDETALRALVKEAAGSEHAQALRFEKLAQKNWVAESLAGLQPVRAGRFIVHGAHDRAKIPGNRTGIEIEAAVAFGTGHHGTTRGCLLALDTICKTDVRRKVHRHPEVRGISASTRIFDTLRRASKGGGQGSHPSRRANGAHLRMTGMRILDLGTGTGVLAIAAARSLRAHVIATDIDGPSVRAARDNMRLNRVSSYVEAIKADGISSLRQRGPFDLIFANILLRPLQRLATPLTKLIAPGGCIILSGILRSQANATIASYHGLVLERRTDIEGWTTLIMRKPRRRSVRVVRRGPGQLFIGA
jgi:ribosomal protein L11 methyltransferase